MNAWAQGEGQPGLGYIFWRKEGDEARRRRARSPRTSARSAPKRSARSLAWRGDAAFFVAGDPKKFVAFAGAARTRAGEELNLVDRDRFELCWIVDFPFFEWDEEEKKIDFAHNPFSMPQGGMEALTSEDPLTSRRSSTTWSATASRSHRAASATICPKRWSRRSRFVGLSRETVEERFGGLYRAFQYGAPPHGGMAAGIDRIIMLLVGAKNLREVTMFPMNQQAQDLLMNAPSEATPTQLRELALRVAAKPEPKG